MTNNSEFKALTPETLSTRLGTNEALIKHLGPNSSAWKTREVGDGNLNLVFIVEGDQGSVIVKQALPFVRLVGDSWPLPLKRSFFEYHALIRQADRAPGTVPQVYFFDETQAIIVMEFLSPHIILRHGLIGGNHYAHLAPTMGKFLAHTLFRGSDFSMSTKLKKSDVALFSDNAELCDITEALVFTDPYYDATLNHHTSPQLDGWVARLKTDSALKVAAQNLKLLFTSSTQTLLHGDLHTGSIMVTDHETKVIDPEFAFYGPISFDIGMLLANIWMSYFSQSAHRSTEDLAPMQSYLLETVDEIWSIFKAEFTELWHKERTGILFPQSLFEDQGDTAGIQLGLEQTLSQIWHELVGFAGLECHRRILGLAHNADFETIENPDIRAACEAKSLAFGRHLILHRNDLHSPAEVNAFATQIDQGVHL